VDENEDEVHGNIGFDFVDLGIQNQFNFKENEYLNS
jgi:hypothetical protein